MTPAATERLVALTTNTFTFGGEKAAPGGVLAPSRTFQVRSFAAALPRLFLTRQAMNVVAVWTT